MDRRILSIVLWAIVILAMVALKAQSQETGFEAVGPDELCQIEASLNQFGAGMKLISGQRHRWDGTRFVKGRDKTGALWIFVLTHPTPTTTKIEQYPCKESKP